MADCTPLDYCDKGDGRAFYLSKFSESLSLSLSLFPSIPFCLSFSVFTGLAVHYSVCGKSGGGLFWVNWSLGCLALWAGRKTRWRCSCMNKAGICLRERRYSWVCVCVCVCVHGSGGEGGVADTPG